MDQMTWTITRIEPQTKQSASIYLNNESGQPFSYAAGQFLTLLFNLNNKELRRSYSFSSCPESDPEISITVKRVPNGEISRHLLDHLRPGNKLVSLPAAGRFTVNTPAFPPKQFFFIAAGSGIVPVFSLLKKILWNDPASLCTLIYQNHDEEEIIFDAELRGLENKYPGQFRWLSLLSRPATPGRNPERLTNFLLEKLVKEYRALPDCLFYLCGPPAFMRMAQFSLRLMGYADDQIRKENFTIEYIPPPPPIADKQPKQVSLDFGGKKFIFPVIYPANILEAALAHHIPLPYSCRGGRCSTCVAQCLSGSIHMSVNEVLTDEEIRQGLVLTCVGYAETDLELRL